jgi:2'-5' RNA ligase
MEAAPSNAALFYRLFVAVTLPEDVKAAVEKAQAELRRSAPGSAVRWATRDQFHLTLKFLGNVESARVDSLSAGLELACRPFSPLRFRAARIGFFPNQRRPRVVWVGVTDRDERLSLLQRAVEAAASGFTSEEREGRFTGHVTLGRVKDPNASVALSLGGVSEAMAGRLFGEWTASHVELIRSELSPAGARYTTLREVPLPGPSAA